MKIEELRERINQPVELHFNDGEVVEVMLLAVDFERDRDLTFEVRKIVKVGTPRARGTEAGGTCIARIDELTKWEPL